MYENLPRRQKTIDALPADVKLRRIALTRELDRLDRAFVRKYIRSLEESEGVLKPDPDPDLERVKRQIDEFFETHSEEFPEGRDIYTLDELEEVIAKRSVSRTRQAAFDWPTILATSTLTPFLGAIANQYGGKAASSLGPWARRGIRRLVRRQMHAARPGGVIPGRRPGIPRRILQLSHENGISILLDEHIPAEGVVEIFDLDFTSLVDEYDAPPFVAWSEGAREWRAQGTKGNTAFYSLWDSGQQEWRHGVSPDEGDSR